MKSAQRTLVLVDQSAPDGQAGGVEHQLTIMEDACNSLDRPVVRVPIEAVTGALRKISPGKALVFTQQEGALSADYARQATEWLSSGAIVVERNVFALPSPWRPRDPNYVMALMSMDGAHRLKLRSLWGGASRPYTWTCLPCPHNDVVSPDHLRDREVDLHFLRAGRPDVRKWSSFEMHFVRRAAEAHPRMTFRLTLVGFPDEMNPMRMPANVELVALPYLHRSQLKKMYGRAHVYLHHSRIGETFGKTLAEAAASGMRIIFGTEPRWDCAPIEFLPATSVVGTPRHLCRSAPQIVQQLKKEPARSGKRQLEGQEYVRLLSAAAEQCNIVPEPRMRDSLRYLMNLRDHISGATPFDCAKAVATEVVRGYQKTRGSR